MSSINTLALISDGQLWDKHPGIGEWAEWFAAQQDSDTKHFPVSWMYERDREDEHIKSGRPRGGVYLTKTRYYNAAKELNITPLKVGNTTMVTMLNARRILCAMHSFPSIKAFLEAESKKKAGEAKVASLKDYRKMMEELVWFADQNLPIRATVLAHAFGTTTDTLRRWSGSEKEGKFGFRFIEDGKAWGNEVTYRLEKKDPPQSVLAPAMMKALPAAEEPQKTGIGFHTDEKVAQMRGYLLPSARAGVQLPSF